MSGTPWIIWPFVALVRLLGAIVGLAGRLVAIVLGLVMMLVGAILCITVVGAVAGIPLILLGFGLILRALF